MNMHQRQHAKEAERYRQRAAECWRDAFRYSENRQELIEHARAYEAMAGKHDLVAASKMTCRCKNHPWAYAVPY